MKVSVVMCSYNVSRFIDRSIQSILTQTYTDWELIISDDCSTDNTVELIEPYLADARIKLVRQPRNLGYVANKNAALKLATGDLVTQLDSDDTCHPDRLEKQVDAFKRNPDVKVCATCFDVIDEEDKLFELPRQMEKEGFVATPMLEYPFCLNSIMMSKEMWQETGYFNPYFSGSVGEDQYLVWHLNTRYPIYVIPEILNSYRINHTSVTHTYDNPRKLIGGLLLAELHRQITTTGSDWLLEGNIDAALDYEQKLLSDKDIMAERYRIWAAKAVHKGSFDEASTLIGKSLKAKLLHPRTYATIKYYLKERFF